METSEKPDAQSLFHVISATSRSKRQNVTRSMDEKHNQLSQRGLTASLTLNVPSGRVMYTASQAG